MPESESEEVVVGVEALESRRLAVGDGYAFGTGGSVGNQLSVHLAARWASSWVSMNPKSWSQCARLCCSYEVRFAVDIYPFEFLLWVITLPLQGSPTAIDTSRRVLTFSS